MRLAQERFPKIYFHSLREHAGLALGSAGQIGEKNWDQTPVMTPVEPFCAESSELLLVPRSTTDGDEG